VSVTKGGQKKKQWWPLSNEPIKKFNCSSSLYNIQLLPSYEMNIETCQLKGGCFPEGIHPMRKKITSRGLTTWCSSHMKANTVFYTETILRCYNNFNVLFCRRQQNNFRDSSKHYETGLVKKNRIFKTLSVVRGCAPSDNLLSYSILYMFGLFIRLSLSSGIFP